MGVREKKEERKQLHADLHEVFTEMLEKMKDIPNIDKHRIGRNYKAQVVGDVKTLSKKLNPKQFSKVKPMPKLDIDVKVKEEMAEGIIADSGSNDLEQTKALSTRLTKDRKAKIKAMHQQGKDVATISQALQVHPNTVQRGIES